MNDPVSIYESGLSQPVDPPVPLRAGQLSLYYQDGGIRSIRLGEVEVVRRVYMALRDRNWDTIPAKLSELTLDVRADSFRIAFLARHQRNGIDFSWRGAISGRSDSSIEFTMDGTAHSSFLRNRIGFCVLHPDTLAGVACAVEQVDGVKLAGLFPVRIAPHQPFKQIRQIEHPVLPGVEAVIRCTGDSFEMEDQRNWSDASYKTYCTPLDRPLPAEVLTGTRIRQAVAIRLQGRLPAVLPPTRPAEAVRLAPRSGLELALPSLGLGYAVPAEPWSAGEIERLRRLNLSHLRLELRPERPDAAPLLERAAQDAAAIDVPLLVALHLAEEPEPQLAQFHSLLHTFRLRLAGVLVLRDGLPSNRAAELRLAREILAEYDPALPIGGGTDGYFTEVNRERPPLAACDFVAYSTTPQVHAFDNASLIESFAGQRANLESARAFAGSKPVWVSPVTFKKRPKSASRTAPAHLPGGELPPQVDTRQLSLFGAGWTLGSILALAEGGAAAATYYETTGWLGVMERPAGSPSPALFPSLPGAVFPLYFSLAWVGEFRGGRAVPLDSGDPLAVSGFILNRDGRSRLILVNHSGEPQPVRLKGWAGSSRVRILDSPHLAAALNDPFLLLDDRGAAQPFAAEETALTLPPYGILVADRP
jgi:hypothetical protein